MLKKILCTIKRAAQMAIVVMIGFSVSLGIYISIEESLKFPQDHELRGLDNISRDLSARETRAVTASRNSILHVLSSREDSRGVSSMSGTYVEHEDRFYVITAAHGVSGDCTRFFVATDSDNIYDCVRYIVIDRFKDYAIIEIEQVAGRTPVKLKEIIPTNREWLQETAALNSVFYTGYPNSLGPLTFQGSVAGVSDENYIFLHSYAWPGSSGAGVFSYSGNMIGIIIALNVGYTAAGYDVLEDLVIVTPLFMIDWPAAYNIMDDAPTAYDTGGTE